MNIALVSAAIASTDLSFYSSQQINLAKGLAALGHIVDVVTIAHQAPGRHQVAKGVQIHRLPGRNGIFWGLQGFLARGAYEVVQVSGDYNPTALMQCFSKGTAKYVLYWGLNELSHKFWKACVGEVYFRTALPLMRRKYSVAVGKTQSATQLLKRYGFDNANTIHVGFDQELFVPPQKPVNKTRLNILYVGNLLARRRLDVQLRAMRMLVDWDLDPILRLVGIGPEKGKLKALVTELKLDSNVEFLGRVPNHELPKLYHSAHCLLFTPAYEIFGQVFLEALACGCPVVCTPVPAAADLVNSENGILVDHGDAVQLAEGVWSIIQSVNTLTPHRVAASVAHLGWLNVAKDYSALYKGL